jgi:hypothetical protein
MNRKIYGTLCIGILFGSTYGAQAQTREETLEFILQKSVINGIDFSLPGIEDFHIQELLPCVVWVSARWKSSESRKFDVPMRLQINFNRLSNNTFSVEKDKYDLYTSVSLHGESDAVRVSEAWIRTNAFLNTIEKVESQSYDYLYLKLWDRTRGVKAFEYFISKFCRGNGRVW